MGCNDPNILFNGHKFKTEGRVLIEPSWLAIYGKDKQPEDSLPALTSNDNGESKLLDALLEKDLT